MKCPNLRKKNKEDPDFYNEKMICVECSGIATWDPDFKEFFEDTLKPNVELLAKTPVFRTKPTVVMSDPPVERVQYFSYMLPTDKILDIVKTFYVDDDESPHESVEGYLKTSPDFLYSLWPRGKVPVDDVIHTFNLGETHLDPKDWNRYTVFLDDLQRQAEEVLDDDDTDGVRNLNEDIHGESGTEDEED